MASLGASASVDLESAEVVVRFAEGQPNVGLETIVETIEEVFRRKGKPITISVLDAG